MEKAKLKQKCLGNGTRWERLRKVGLYNLEIELPGGCRS